MALGTKSIFSTLSPTCFLGRNASPCFLFGKRHFWSKHMISKFESNVMVETSHVEDSCFCQKDLYVEAEVETCCGQNFHVSVNKTFLSKQSEISVDERLCNCRNWICQS